MKTGKKVSGRCSLCTKPKEGDVIQVSGISGLKPMTLCTDHILLVSDLEAQPEDREDHTLFDRASA